LDIEVQAIPGYEGYFVSTDGDIISTRKGSARKLKPYVNSKGYFQVKTAYGHLYIHRAIALTYVQRVDTLLNDVNHIDGDKKNNSISNLEWVSRGSNVIHALRNGLHSNRETAVCGVHTASGDGVWFISQAEAAKHGFIQANISHCLAGNRHSHRGYTWSKA
jgi:hypothetical protein